MPYVSTNGIRLAYERTGRGERVLLIMGQAAGGNVWSMYQVPALKSASYEVITFDNRGVPPSDVPPGDYSLADLVADTAGDRRAESGSHLVRTSLGAFVAPNCIVGGPGQLLRWMTMRGRMRFVVRYRLGKALAQRIQQLPPTSLSRVLRMFSPCL
jgi:pimeloyl-ACP methyl ester carboxylesterase